MSWFFANNRDQFFSQQYQLIVAVCCFAVAATFLLITKKEAMRIFNYASITMNVKCHLLVLITGEVTAVCERGVAQHPCD